MAQPPLLSGVVSTQGVVVGDYEGPSPALRGFSLQDVTGDNAQNPATIAFGRNGQPLSAANTATGMGGVMTYACIGGIGGAALECRGAQDAVERDRQQALIDADACTGQVNAMGQDAIRSRSAWHWARIEI